MVIVFVRVILIRKVDRRPSVIPRTTPTKVNRRSPSRNAMHEAENSCSPPRVTGRTTTLGAATRLEPMKLVLKFHSVPRHPELVEHVRHRASFEMGRFARRLVRLDVTLADENGPRGGLDKTCRIAARLRDLAPVVISTTDSCERDAVNRSFQRLRRTVARALERGREDRKADARRRLPSRIVAGACDPTSPGKDEDST